MRKQPHMHQLWILFNVGMFVVFCRKWLSGRTFCGHGSELKECWRRDWRKEKLVESGGILVELENDPLRMANLPVKIFKVLGEVCLSMFIFDEDGHKLGGRGFRLEAVEVSLSHWVGGHQSCSRSGKCCGETFYKLLETTLVCDQRTSNWVWSCREMPWIICQKEEVVVGKSWVLILWG